MCEKQLFSTNDIQPKRDISLLERLENHGVLLLHVLNVQPPSIPPESFSPKKLYIVAIFFSHVFNGNLVHTIAAGMERCLPVLHRYALTLHVGFTTLHVVQTFIRRVKDGVKLCVICEVGGVQLNAPKGGNSVPHISWIQSHHTPSVRGVTSIHIWILALKFLFFQSECGWWRQVHLWK